jgi:hypothetical protein
MIRSSNSFTLGSSVMTPTTCPVGNTPTSGRPSTSPAFVYIGAFGAIANCPHVSSCDFFIASPSRNRSIMLASDKARNWNACTAARASAATCVLPSSASISFVRMTRCGTPSIDFVTTVPVSGVST